jgi:hypothetical protein
MDPWNVCMSVCINVCICTMGGDFHLLNTSAFDSIYFKFLGLRCMHILQILVYKNLFCAIFSMHQLLTTIKAAITGTV